MIRTRSIVFGPIVALCLGGFAACVVEDDLEREELLDDDDEDLDAGESLTIAPAPQAAKKPKKKCNDPSRTYVSHDPDECALLQFFCAEGQAPFFDACGCGCEPVGETCGPTTCDAGQVCCNASCGICTEPGGFCTQQFCEPVG
jgi:hypothetical protein